MKKLLLLSAALMLGCPNPQTGAIDPYLTARTVIMQAQVGMAVADGIFGQWALMQTDKDKAAKAQETYTKIKGAVANGLQLALDGVDIAEQAKKDPDVTKLLAQANEAWGSLHKFLGDLLGPMPAAASQPTPSGVGSSTHALSAPDPYKELKAQFAKMPKKIGK